MKDRILVAILKPLNAVLARLSRALREAAR
jgi:hypothetical protein